MIRLSRDIQAIWCSCHTIALVVNDGFKETIDYICIREVVDKVHDLLDGLKKEEMNSKTPARRRVYNFSSLRRWPPLVGTPSMILWLQS